MGLSYAVVAEAPASSTDSVLPTALTVLLISSSEHVCFMLFANPNLLYPRCCWLAVTSKFDNVTLYLLRAWHLVKTLGL